MRKRKAAMKNVSITFMFILLSAPLFAQAGGNSEATVGGDRGGFGFSFGGRPSTGGGDSPSTEKNWGGKNFDGGDKQSNPGHERGGGNSPSSGAGGPRRDFSESHSGIDIEHMNQTAQEKLSSISMDRYIQSPVKAGIPQLNFDGPSFGPADNRPPGEPQSDFAKEFKKGIQNSLANKNASLLAGALKMIDPTLKERVKDKIEGGEEGAAGRVAGAALGEAVVMGEAAIAGAITHSLFPGASLVIGLGYEGFQKGREQYDNYKRDRDEAEAADLLGGKK